MKKINEIYLVFFKELQKSNSRKNFDKIDENNMKSIVGNTSVEWPETSAPFGVTIGFMAGVLGEMAGSLLGGGGDGLLGLENFFGTAGSRWAFGWVATGGCRTLDLLVWL